MHRESSKNRSCKDNNPGSSLLEFQGPPPRHGLFLLLCCTLIRAQVDYEFRLSVLSSYTREGEDTGVKSLGLEALTRIRGLSPDLQGLILPGPHTSIRRHCALQFQSSVP